MSRTLRIGKQSVPSGAKISWNRSEGGHCTSKDGQWRIVPLYAQKQLDQRAQETRSAMVAPHFILLGRHARNSFESNLGPLSKWAVLDGATVLKRWYVARNITATYSAHPSPLSADRGFFGSRPFSRANFALTLNNPGCAPVDWRLS